MMQYFRRRSPDLNGGFTLIELLVIVVIVGILSAIAAPGWLAFVNNQRISKVRSQAADTIRRAQTDAKTTRTMRAVVLDRDSDPPRIAITRCQTLAASTESASAQCEIPAALDWRTLGDGEILSGAVRYSDATKAQPSKTYGGRPAMKLVFDANGIVKLGLSDVKSGAGLSDAAPLFMVGFQLTKSQNAQPRCVVVQTLLGGLREANAKDKPNEPGCGA